MKKSRQCFNANQIEELEKLFITTNYPDTLTRQQLAAKMKVSESRIQVISFTCNLLLTPLSSNLTNWSNTLKQFVDNSRRIV